MFSAMNRGSLCLLHQIQITVQALHAAACMFHHTDMHFSLPVDSGDNDMPAPVATHDFGFSHKLPTDVLLQDVFSSTSV